MSRIMTTVITSLLFTGMSLAQNTSASDQETIRLLVQQVKELQEKVKTLEAKQSDSEATPPRTARQGQSFGKQHSRAQSPRRRSPLRSRQKNPPTQLNRSLPRR